MNLELETSILDAKIIVSRVLVSNFRDKPFSRASLVWSFSQWRCAMQTVVSRTLSVHQEHELLLKLESAGLDVELAQKVIDARGNKLATKLVNVLRNVTPQQKGYEPARTILGDDFISPEEVAEARGISYTEEQLKQLADTLPPAEMLQWCKDNDYAVVAGSPTEMSLLDVRSAKSSLFYSKTEGWYAGQPFAANEKVVCQWLAIRKTEVINSLNKKWDAQQKLLSKDEEVPNAAEMSWFITTYYKVRDVCLFKGIYVRTSSVTSDNRRVNVGGWGGSGLNVHYFWDDFYHSYLGVSASRKF